MAAGVKEEAAVFVVQANLWGLDAMAVAVPKLSPSMRRWESVDGSALVSLILRGGDIGGCRDQGENLPRAAATGLGLGFELVFVVRLLRRPGKQRVSSRRAALLRRGTAVLEAHVPTGHVESAAFPLARLGRVLEDNPDRVLLRLAPNNDRVELAFLVKL